MGKFSFKDVFNWFSISFVIFIIEILIGLSILPMDYTSANNGADAGDFLAAILTGGIPHPTGYPTYLLFGRLFQSYPFGTPYFKTAILSLLFSSLAVGFLSYFFYSALGKDDKKSVSLIAAFAVGITLGTTPLFLSQAVIVEVHGLQSFFMICTLIWVLQILRGPETRTSDTLLSILSLVIGLGAGNHVMIILMVPVIIFVIIYSKNNNRYDFRKLLKYFGISALAVILVYATLPLRARQFPPINWGNPQSWEGFLWLVSGKLYHGLAFGIPISEIIQRIGYFAGFLVEQFGILGVFIGILGMVKTSTAPARIKWVYLWMFFSYSIFSINYQTNDSIVYLIPSLIVFSVWIGNGLKEFWDDFEVNPLLGKAIVCLFFLILLFRLPGIRDKVDPRKDNSSRLYAEQCFIALPQNAILITENDSDTFPIWYYHFGLGKRSDLRVVVRNLLNLEWYRETLTHTYPGLILPDLNASNLSEQFLVLNPDVRVCITQNEPSSTNSYECVCPIN